MRLLLCLMLLSFEHFSQDSILPKDSMKLSYHQKSMLCSALVPGLGQIRNSHDAANLQAVWKVPLIYGGLGAAGYFLISNQQTQLSLKQEYTAAASTQLGRPTTTKLFCSSTVNI